MFCCNYWHFLLICVVYSSIQVGARSTVVSLAAYLAGILVLARRFVRALLRRLGYAGNR